MSNKNIEIKSALLCALAFALGLFVVSLAGCKTAGKIEGGAELIQIEPAKSQK